MGEQFRVATWNLERCSSRSWKKAPAQARRIAEVDADIWVLTETFTDRSPGVDYVACFSPHHPERRPDPNERWTAIWSRWPMSPLADPPPHRRGTVAALIDAPFGPLIVCGSVIAWANEPVLDDGRPAKVWEVHLAEIERQSAEWEAIRQQYPDVPLVVAGDLNQGRSGRKWDYGTNATRRALTEGLERAGLRCVTEVDLVDNGPLDRSHVDHICLSPHLAVEGEVMVWDRADATGVRLSDHPTLAIDLVAASG